MTASTGFRMALSLFTARGAIWTYARLGDPVARVLQPGTDPLPRWYDAVRQAGPVVRSRLGLWASASYPVVSEVVRDNRFGVVPLPEDPWTRLRPREALSTDSSIHPINDSFLSKDPPDHTRLRRLAAPWFTPRALRERVGRVEQVVERDLDRLDTSRPIDLITEFAVRVPIQVICDLLGIAEPQHERFARWGQVLGRTLDGVRTVRELRWLQQTVAEMGTFFDELLAHKRQHPGDDVMSDLLAARVDGAPVGPADLVATTQLLLVAGFETTVNLIGNGVLTLLSHPREKQRFLANPDLADNVVEEVLRYESPVQFTMRVAKEDVTLAGTLLRRHTPVLLLLSGANRDPAVFADRNRFDIGRENARDHLSFSGGIHYCLGAGLARIEGAVALRALFQRFPALELAGAPRPRSSRLIHGVGSLPVRCIAGRREVLA
ncbi:cytochrome P450 [Longimycelium tulufanense]|uniref:Cytochrome P450 n=1 Tax=Longimycelium tulufanense TaxID=907463 RepID=A0A8J3C8U9_9PSEU|nr:cytochrome P450 [Longimycelium tulufanense]GGM56412.1 cytochrome P450 [Longimycelium tulufanense]